MSRLNLNILTEAVPVAIAKLHFFLKASTRMETAPTGHISMPTELCRAAILMANACSRLFLRNCLPLMFIGMALAQITNSSAQTLLIFHRNLCQEAAVKTALSAQAPFLRQ